MIGGVFFSSIQFAFLAGAVERGLPDALGAIRGNRSSYGSVEIRAPLPALPLHDPLHVRMNAEKRLEASETASGSSPALPTRIA